MDEATQTVEVRFAGIDPDKRMFGDIDISLAPAFTTVTVAKIFFFRSASWVRLAMREGKFDKRKPSGRGKVVPIEPHRNVHNVREFSFDDIETMAHNAFSNGLISHDHFMNVLAVLASIGRGYGVIS